MVKSEHKIQSETSTKPIATSTSTSTSSKKKYKGVRMRSWGSWVSEIRAPNQKTRIWLGSYSTAEAAARAYDAALLCLKGPSANLNFPTRTSSHCIPADTVMSPKSIQRVAAAAAANSFIDNATATTNTTTTSSTTTTTTTPVSSPPLPAASSPSPSSSSSSMSSPSLSDQLDIYDDVYLMQSFGTYNSHDDYSWYNFDDQLQSPKFLDLMFMNNIGAASPFNPPPMMIDDFFEGDFHLWSFAE